MHNNRETVIIPQTIIVTTKSIIVAFLVPLCANHLSLNQIIVPQENHPTQWAFHYPALITITFLTTQEPKRPTLWQIDKQLHTNGDKKKEVRSLISNILLHDTAQKHQIQRMKLKTSSFTCYVHYASVATCWKSTFQTSPSLDTRTRPLGTHTHIHTQADNNGLSKWIQNEEPKNLLCACDTSVCFWHF